jgi:hypothetical protein
VEPIGRAGQLSGHVGRPRPSAMTPTSGAILLSLIILHDIVSYAGGFIEVASTAAGATMVNVYLQLKSDI